MNIIRDPNSLLKQISNGKVDYSQIVVSGYINVMLPGWAQPDLHDEYEELGFTDTPIGEVFEQLNEIELWTRDYYWKWGVDGDDRVIVVSTPKGSTDFTDFARFVDWVRVFVDADDDCDQYDIQA